MSNLPGWTVRDWDFVLWLTVIDAAEA